MEQNNKESYENWIKGFEGLSFEDSAKRYRDKIIESPELDKKSKKYFTDAFEYILDLQKKNKPLDVKQMKIHMCDIKGYEALTLEEFTRTLLLLGLCGFEFNLEN